MHLGLFGYHWTDFEVRDHGELEEFGFLGQRGDNLKTALKFTNDDF
jgi:hypothetical protein